MGDAHKAGFGLRKMIDRRDRAFEVVELARRLIERERAERRQAALALALEQRCIQVLFELLEHHRHRRRRAAELLCGIG